LKIQYAIDFDIQDSQLYNWSALKLLCVQYIILKIWVKFYAFIVIDSFV